MNDFAAPFTHAALIRGINVGGNNIVPMARLRDGLLAAGTGVARVATYIQSGNVLLAAPGRTVAEVAGLVEAVLATDFAVETPVVAVTVDHLAAVIANAPKGFGAGGDAYKDDVVFLRNTLTVDDALAVVRTRAAVDQAFGGDGVVYFRRVAALAGKSYLSKVVSTPAYRHMTIRNWRTAAALLALARPSDATE